METANSEITTMAELTEADAKASKDIGGESEPPAKVDGTPEDKSKSAPETDIADWTPKAQERYHQLTREKYDALGERDRERYDKEQTRAENARLKSQLEEFTKTAKTPEVAPPNSRPTLEQYGYDEPKFYEALDAYYEAKNASATETARTTAQEVIQAERDKAAAEQANQSWATKEAEFAKSKPDYMAKSRAHPRDGGPIITDSMVEIIKGSKIGPQLVYHLAENTEKSALIAQLPPLAQALEFGRIEAKLEAAKAPPPPPVSKAPPPPSKVDSEESPLTGISTTSPDSDKLSDDAWVKAENARLRRKQQRSA